MSSALRVHCAYSGERIARQVGRADCALCAEDTETECKSIVGGKRVDASTLDRDKTPWEMRGEVTMLALARHSGGPCSEVLEGGVG
jgi:hypothetical protein